MAARLTRPHFGLTPQTDTHKKSHLAVAFWAIAERLLLGGVGSTLGSVSSAFDGISSTLGGIGSALGGVSSTSGSASHAGSSTSGSGSSASGCRSGFSSGCSSRSGCSGRSRCSSRSGFFFFATSGQGSGCNQGRQNERFFHFNVP